MEHKFTILQGKKKAQILIYSSTITATALFGLYITWMIYLRAFSADIIMGLVIFLVSGLVLYDLLLYKVRITKEDIIISRLVGKKKVIPINKIKKKMQLVHVTGYGISNNHLLFYFKGDEIKIRYANDDLINYLRGRGFNISKQ